MLKQQGASGSQLAMAAVKGVVPMLSGGSQASKKLTPGGSRLIFFAHDGSVDRRSARSPKYVVGCG